MEARLPELGMMVEVPAAALTIGEFPAAFFSIGANDLTQFVTACDRANGAVSAPFDPMSPAMLELIRRVVDHGRASGKSVSLCGDVAGDPRRVLTLLNCGLRELSMSPNSLAAVKSAILESSQGGAPCLKQPPRRPTSRTPSPPTRRSSRPFSTSARPACGLRLADALGKNRSFISQISNPIYATPIPAQHLSDHFPALPFLGG